MSAIVRLVPPVDRLDLDEGTLLPLLPEWLASPYEDRQDEIHAVFRGGRFLKPQTRAFIDFLVEAIRPLQGPR